jgi:DNA repair exonuclease SbcCD ATPase subunit
MINFRTIKWKNLLSTGNQYNVVQLDKSPTTCVRGINGSGKTTMLDALTFVLFGKPFRNVNINQIVNSINAKDCVVEIEFTIDTSEYKVVRGLAPKIFNIEKDGVPLDQTATVKDYQQILEKHILKMNYKTFCQVVILGSTNYIPFMRLSAADRRNIVESLLDIDVFSKMNDALKIRVLESKEELRRLESFRSGLETKIEYKKDMIQKIEEKSESQFQSYRKQETDEQNTLDGIADKRLAIQQDISGLTLSVEAVDKKKDSLSTLSGLKKQMVNGIKKAAEDTAFYHDNTDCPVCQQSINAEFRECEIGKKKVRISELESALQKMTIMIEQTKKELETASSVVTEMQAKVSEFASLNSSAEASKRYIKQLRELQEKTKRELDSLQTERETLLKLQLELDQSDVDKKTAIEASHTMDIASVLLKDSGIKRKIIRKYIPALNKIINKYLTAMDFFAQFTLNEDFVEVIKSRFRDTFSYENFSEGEKLRIDVALLLAWRDIAKMKNSANTNLLILDEVFDSSLDAVGTDEIVKILQTMGGTNNIFVISHKSDQLIDKFHDVMSFEKVKNFSKIC